MPIALEQFVLPYRLFQEGHLEACSYPVLVHVILKTKPKETKQTNNKNNRAFAFCADCILLSIFPCVHAVSQEQQACELSAVLPEKLPWSGHDLLLLFTSFLSDCASVNN